MTEHQEYLKEAKRRRRCAIREELEAGLRERAIPTHMHLAIHTHVVDRRKVGRFLTAVLENNLSEAVSRADPKNYEATYLRQWTQLLYNYCPGDCWGSPAKVKAWLKGDTDGGGDTQETERQA